jgi:phenylacetate-coenzyme A ligase PaaK-like adenylate-forming protein
MPAALSEAAARTSLYGVPPNGSAHPSGYAAPVLDLNGLVRHGEALDDLFAGRRDPLADASCILQAGDGLPLYLALTREDVAAAARALASCWRLAGVRKGDGVLIYDYGTSPLTLFASWAYIPGLPRGAADLLGATPICNDGMPEFAARALHVLRYFRPRVMFVDAELMAVLVMRASEEREPLSRWTDLLVVSSEEEGITAAQKAAWSEALGVPMRSLLRAGSALFFAGECEQGALHVDPRFYRPEVLLDGHDVPSRAGEGGLCITNLFLRGTSVIRYLTGVRVTLRGRECGCGRAGVPLRQAE